MQKLQKVFKAHDLYLQTSRNADLIAWQGVEETQLRRKDGKFERKKRQKERARERERERERARELYIYTHAKVRFGAPLFIGVLGPKMAKKTSYIRKLRATFPAERSKFWPPETINWGVFHYPWPEQFRNTPILWPHSPPPGFRAFFWKCKIKEAL